MRQSFAINLTAAHASVCVPHMLASLASVFKSCLSILGFDFVSVMGFVAGDLRYLWGGNEDTASEVVLVPTHQHIALQHAMLHLYKSSHPILVHGAAGSGKSSLVQDLMATLDPEQVLCATMTLSAGTQPQHLQTWLEVGLEHKSGRLYAPHGTKRACFFIDDLHLPRHDGCGTQGVLELMRHMLDYGNWFDLHLCVERVIQNCSFVAAMAPSASSLTHPRVRRHFACLHLEPPSVEGLQHIYETIAVSMLRTLEPEVQRMAPILAQSSVKILIDLSSVLIATPDRPHYSFTQHDLAKIFHGMQAHAGLCTSAVSVAHLWLFNCNTTFMRRLVNQEDGSMCQRIIGRALDMMQQHVGTSEPWPLHARAAGFPAFLCVKQHGRALCPTVVQDAEELRRHMTESLDPCMPCVAVTCNRPGRSADLCGMAALYHVNISHLSMALGHAGGHALLMGPGGAGKKSVAAVVARLLGYKLVEVHLKDCSTQAQAQEWPDHSLHASTDGSQLDASQVLASHVLEEQAEQVRTRLAALCWEAGINHTEMAVLVHEEVLQNAEAAAWISQVLPPAGFSQMMAMFPDARRLDIYSALKKEVRKMGMVDTHDNCGRLFTTQVHRHLHLVVLASTTGDLNWGRTVQGFPFLLTSMSVCYFGAHRTDKLQDFASVYLGAELLNERHSRGSKTEGKKQEQVSPITSGDVIMQAARHMTLVHQAAIEMATKQSAPIPAPRQAQAGMRPSSDSGMRRVARGDKRLTVTLPNASVAWYCQAWSSIYVSRRTRVVWRHEMATRASSKLEAALTRLSDLQTSIEDQKQMVEQKKMVAKRLLAQVGQETALLDQQRHVLLDDERKQLDLSENLAELQVWAYLYASVSASVSGCKRV